MAKHRSPWVAILFSILSPSGLAQLYNGQPKKAAVFLALYSLTVLSLAFTGMATTLHGYGMLLLFGFALLIASFVDALKNSGRDISLKWYNRWYFYLVYYIAVVITANYYKFTNIESFKIPGDAMYPTIVAGDRIVVDKRAITRNDLRRGDLIVFSYVENRNKKFFKRVIGLPGDRVRTEGTDLFVNNQKVTHTPVKSEDNMTMLMEGLGGYHYHVQYAPYRSYADQEYLVPDGQLFMMGDNRDNSADSREYGPIPMTDVVGKASFIYWSPDRSRIGKSLSTH